MRYTYTNEIRQKQEDFQMEHSNPILMGNNSPQKFITIGEVMLR